MAAKEWTEQQLKNLIRDTLKQELKDIYKSIDDIKDKQKALTDEEKVKEIVVDTIVNMHKYLWQKSNTYRRQI